MAIVAHVSNVFKDIMLVTMDSVKEFRLTVDCSIWNLDHVRLVLLHINLLMEYVSLLQPIQLIQLQIRILDARHGATISAHNVQINGTSIKTVLVKKLMITVKLGIIQDNVLAVTLDTT